MQLILIINAGSSSVKFQLFTKQNLTLIAKGQCESIGIGGKFSISFNNQKHELDQEFKTQKDALDFLLKYLMQNKIINDVSDVIGVGHRIVHGGTKINESCIVNDNVIKIIQEYIDLAPLHLIPELAALDTLMKLFKKAKHVLVFDTSFHKSIPYWNYMYGVKKEWLEKYEVRKFGFHGISYHYVLNRMQKILNKDKLNLIICHLGSGCSLCAIKDSQSINTSMGFSAMDGLIMGTRTGDISATIIDYVAKKTNQTHQHIMNLCMKESGLKGLTGFNDMRYIETHLNNQEIKQGLDVFIKRIVDYMSISLNDLDNKIDAIVFCGGIGENSQIVRKLIIEAFKLKKLSLNEQMNNQKIKKDMKISDENSEVDIYVINTNEEKMIAKEVLKILN